MEEKIKIMSLLDLIFNLPKNERSVKFSVIALKANIAIDEVELLVMRAMSLELIKGYID